MRDDGIFRALLEFDENEALLYQSLGLYERRLYRNCVRGKVITRCNCPSSWLERRENGGEMSFVSIAKALDLPYAEVLKIHAEAIGKIKALLGEDDAKA